MKEIRFLVVGLSVLSGVFSAGAADVQWTEVRPADVEGLTPILREVLSSRVAGGAN